MNTPYKLQNKMDNYVITFPSVAHAFRAEKILKLQGVDAKLIPIPRSLSGCCEGLAIVLAKEEVNGAVEVLTRQMVTMLYKGIKVKLD